LVQARRRRPQAAPPHADLEIENRAIGGFASQLRIRPAEHDLYPFYPDLLIFHVYGSNKEYEQIIQQTRLRTAAEVLMQRDHLTKPLPDVIDQNKDKGMWWDNLMNEKILPDIAAKYACGLADIRGGWIDYLKANNLQPKDLLKDGVHLNDHGNYLMAELIERHLHRPDLDNQAWKNLSTDLLLDKDLRWKEGRLTCDFHGNRVDFLPALNDSVSDSSLQIRIDGKKPSEFDGCYRITRPTPGPWSPLALTRVDHEKPLLLEQWTLKLTSVSDDSTKWSYEVQGSLTGPDGAGSNAAPFLSNSGRVKIDPAAFFRNGKIPATHTIRWQVLPMFLDSWTPPKITDPTRDHALTLAQGFPNGPHQLELISVSGKSIPLRGLRIYRPPLPAPQ
jgi:hypothetical protein